MNANDVGKILADGEAKRQAAWADQRLSEQGRAEAGQAIWAAAVASARETAAAVLAENDRAVAVAEQRLVAETTQHEKSIDYSRLAVLQTEWRSLAESGDFADVAAAVETAIRNGDALALRAATAAVPALKNRAKSDFSPLRQDAGRIANLEQTLPQWRSELDPAPLRNARAAHSAAIEQQRAAISTLYGINERSAQNGGPGVLHSPGVTGVEFPRDGKMRFTTNRW